MIQTKPKKREAPSVGDEPTKKAPRLGEKPPAKGEYAKKSFKNRSHTGAGPTAPRAGDKFGNKFSGKNIKDGAKFGNKFGGKNTKDGAKFVNKFRSKNTKDGKSDGTKKDAGSASGEKTDWNKLKLEKKELKLKRKKAKDSYEVSVEAKKIYEKLKCRRTEKKNELVEKLFNLLNTGDIFQKLVMAHDTARIIQCMLKFASPALRESISEKLLPMAVDMAISKYAHFCVMRIFKYGSPAIKSKLVDSFMGNIVKLSGHNISSKILDHVYLTVANPKQKIYMRQEFYGELYRKAKDNNVKELADTYKDTANMKASILGSVKSNLEHLANKELVDSSLVHAVMLEFLRECDEDKMEETVTMFAPLIPLMLTTRDGSQAAIICFYKSTAKNRRSIIKTIKEHIIKICTHEHGHVFMLAVLNSLDDTKATKKAIFDTIHPELQNLMANQYGRRVVEWLVSPGDTNCFHPAFVATIEEGLKYGKKDKDVRRKEIFDQIEEPIANAIAENPGFWISDKHIGLVTADILKRINSENFVRASSALATVITSPTWSVSVEENPKEKTSSKSHDVEKIIEEATKLRKKKQKIKRGEEISEEVEKKQDETTVATVPGIEEAGLHVVLKKIIKHDKERLVQDPNTQTFGALLLQELNEETLPYWITVNRACFVLLNIIENDESCLETLKNLIKRQLAALKQQSAPGPKLLYKKLH